jgi:hypothetical protein
MNPVDVKRDGNRSRISTLVTGGVRAVRTVGFPLAALVPIALGNPADLIGQTHCQADISAGDHPFAYQLRGDRCEGSCGRLTSNTTHLRIVGFRRGSALPAAPAVSELAFRWSPPPGSPTILRVSSVRGRHCYQMDAVRSPLSPNFAWSSRLIRAIGVRPADLAAAVWASSSVDDHPEPVLIPVETERATIPDERFVVEVVPAGEFDEITFSVEGAGGERQYLEPRSAGEAYYPRNTPVMIHLPSTLPRERPLRLLIEAVYEGGSVTTDVLIWLPR